MKAKSEDTKTYIEAQDLLSKGKVLIKLTADQEELWKLTLENLVETLDESAKRTTAVRVKLEKITKDVITLKSVIEGMVATARVRVNAKFKQFEDELKKAQAVAKKNKNCFNNFVNGLLTVVTLGAHCAMMRSTLNKAKKNAREIKSTRLNFENNVVPLVQ